MLLITESCSCAKEGTDVKNRKMRTTVRADVRGKAVWRVNGLSREVAALCADAVGQLGFLMLKFLLLEIQFSN